MFHKAVSVSFLEGTLLEATFQDGQVKRYDMAQMFDKYPQLKALEDHALFQSGKLMGAYGIIWNDDLDIDMQTIYEEGILVQMKPSANEMLAQTISSARAKTGMSQKQIAALAGIDQSDFSKIERGVANPSLSTLERIAKALGGNLTISIVQ